MFFHHIWESVVSWNTEYNSIFQLCTFMAFDIISVDVEGSSLWIFPQAKSACFMHTYKYNAYFIIWFPYSLCLHNPKLTLAFLCANLGTSWYKMKIGEKIMTLFMYACSSQIVNISPVKDKMKRGKMIL